MYQFIPWTYLSCSRSPLLSYRTTVTHMSLFSLRLSGGKPSITTVNNYSLCCVGDVMWYNRSSSWWIWRRFLQLHSTVLCDKFLSSVISGCDRVSCGTVCPGLCGISSATFRGVRACRPLISLCASWNIVHYFGSWCVLLLLMNILHPGVGLWELCAPQLQCFASWFSLWFVSYWRRRDRLLRLTDGGGCGWHCVFLVGW